MTADRREGGRRTIIEIEQGGTVVARVDGPERHAVAEARRYAMIYSQDGPLTMRVKKGNVDLRSIFAPPAAIRERDK